MWVYGKALLKSRLALPRKLGTWLDYWLLLHLDETHSIWCARPLGIQAIAETALFSDGKDKATLRKQLVNEIEDIREFVNFLASVSIIETLPTDPYPIGSNSSWSTNWRLWFEDVIRTDINQIVIELINQLGRTLSGNNWPKIYYYTRRLAGELGQEEFSKHLLLSEVRKRICDSGDFNAKFYDEAQFTAALHHVLVIRDKYDYEVGVLVAPVKISQRVRGSSYIALNKPTLVTELSANGECILKEVKFRVRASHPSLAVTKALKYARNFAEHLRLRKYIPIRFYGSISLCSLVSGEVSHAAPPQPFWTEGEGRRDAPTVPERVHFINKPNWLAARMQLSAAFDDWAEDVHTAAAKVWQALESFTKPLSINTRNCIQTMSSAYMAWLPSELVKYLAIRLTQQGMIMRSAGRRTDWELWNQKWTTFEEWSEVVFDQTSGGYYKNWKWPPAPEVLFNNDVGLLKVAQEELLYPGSQPWMLKRLQSDLTLLYALRNSVVHEGRREYSNRTADYLGRVAVEVLLGVMNSYTSGQSHLIPI